MQFISGEVALILPMPISIEKKINIMELYTK